MENATAIFFSFLYIFFWRTRVWAIPLLMSPIFNSLGMSEFELRVLLYQAGALRT